MLDEFVEVTKNQPLTGGHYLLSLRSPRQAQAARPGQFAMLRLGDPSDVLLRRPMSIYDVRPEGGGKEKAKARNRLRLADLRILQFLYKVVGRGTRRMSELRPGDRVGLLGPLGHGFFEEEYLDEARKVNEVLQVAGGIGIAALLMPAKALAQAGIGQRLFFGGRTKHDLVCAKDFRPYVRQTVLSTEEGSRGHGGFITEPLQAFLERNRDRSYLLIVCGPWGMLSASAGLARQYGHACLVSMENRMGCGLGVCLGCSIRVHGEGHGAYERVCTEGPVFQAEKVVWESEQLPAL